MNKKLISLIIILLITGCKKEEESASDILNTVSIPAKQKVIAPKPIKKESVEPLKTVAPSPSINEVLKTVPVAPITPPITESVAKPSPIEPVKPIPVITTPKPQPIAPIAKAVEVKPLPKVEPSKPITKPLIQEKKQGEVIMSIEFE